MSDSAEHSSSATYPSRSQENTKANGSDREEGRGARAEASREPSSTASSAYTRDLPRHRSHEAPQVGSTPSCGRRMESEQEAEERAARERSQERERIYQERFARKLAMGSGVPRDRTDRYGAVIKSQGRMRVDLRTAREPSSSSIGRRSRTFCRQHSCTGFAWTRAETRRAKSR